VQIELLDLNLTAQRKKELQSQIARLQNEIRTYDLQIRQRRAQIRAR
jgi:hypothetical protein